MIHRSSTRLSLCRFVTTTQNLLLRKSVFHASQIGASMSIFWHSSVETCNVALDCAHIDSFRQDVSEVLFSRRLLDCPPPCGHLLSKPQLIDFDEPHFADAYSGSDPYCGTCIRFECIRILFLLHVIAIELKRNCKASLHFNGILIRFRLHSHCI